MSLLEVGVLLMTTGSDEDVPDSMRYSRRGVSRKPAGLLLHPAKPISDLGELPLLPVVVVVGRLEWCAALVRSRTDVEAGNSDATLTRGPEPDRTEIVPGSDWIEWKLA